MKLGSSRRDGRNALSEPYRAILTALLVLASLVLLAACGGGTVEGGDEAEAPEEETGTSGEAAGEGTTSGEVALTPAGATVGPDENSNMLPAGGREPDPAQPPPEDPPEGVRTFPATTNESVEGSISYDRDPPTNGDHAPIWQNCGFYSEPVENETAVHSMDHGVVWITYRSDLPADQIETLRGLGQEEYVLVSPYSGLSTPVVATAWRNQLELEGADDPRLRQFVDQFRILETAPLSGNKCFSGRGEPEVAPPSAQQEA
ncbi:MAG: DUF3105 domain-containing protein [Gemmatimonadetes bacterium]|nr:DUF3105 domain-containing protein [Gemmatimonadota bacterium]